MLYIYIIILFYTCCFRFALCCYFCIIFIFFLYVYVVLCFFFFFSSRRRHTRSTRDWSSDVCSSDLAPNEEIFLLRRLGAALSARIAAVSWSPPGAFHDDFLVKADKNPNTEGLRLQGLVPDGEVDQLLEAAGAGRLAALVLHRTDLTAWRDAAVVRAALERVPCLVVLDTDRREASEYADVVLPIATYAECDGTFTNHAGRVQRFSAAVSPPGEVRAGWLVLAELAARLAGGEPFAGAEAVFAALAEECAAFRGLS